MERYIGECRHQCQQDIKPGSEGGEQPSILQVALLCEPIIVALPRRHALARRAEIKLRELSDEPFVFFPHGPEPSYADGVLAACAAAGFQPRVVQEAI